MKVRNRKMRLCVEHQAKTSDADVECPFSELHHLEPCGVCDVARCAGKIVRATRCICTPTVLTRESLLAVSETYVQFFQKN